MSFELDRMDNDQRLPEATVVSKVRGSNSSERLMHGPRHLEHDSTTRW